MELTIISDTHGCHEDLGTLAGDVLIHCGDLAASFDADGASVASLDAWFSRQRFDQILYTGGNHDFYLQRQLEKNDQPYRHARYLQDEAFEFGGLIFYGAPWTPFLPGCAFHLEGEPLRRKWNLIPPDVDILITHTPPFGILDQPYGNFKPAGCPHLLARVIEIRPRLHCFGHIHAGFGKKDEGETWFVNSALAGGTNGLKNPPVTFSLRDGCSGWVVE